MDLAWTAILESISLAGPHGIAWDRFKVELRKNMKLEEKQLEWPPGPALKYLLTLFINELWDEYKIGKYPPGEQFKKDPKTKLMFFVDLQSIQITDFTSISNPNDLRFFCSNASIRHSSLFQNRPIQLSESSLQSLEVIAAHGQNGVTQAELAKILGCDPKNAFHWLKSLIANDLIARTPVASKKSFTYLLTLTRYLDEEITAPSENSNHTLLVSSKDIRQRIVDILAKAPSQTMVSKDVFAQAGLDRFLIKHFRRAATKLNEIGWLEYLFEDQLVGPYCRLFKLKRSPAEGLDLNTFLAAQEKAKSQTLQVEEEKLLTSRGHNFNPSHPIIHQLIFLLARAYPEPLTTNQLSHHLNISRKYLYKLIERILPVSAKKTGVIGAEGVEKVSDFVGKEKRLRLFIKSEEWRDYYLNMFSDLSKVTDSTASMSAIPFVTVSRPSTPLTASSSVAQSPSDTRTRQLRHQALLSELEAKKILEVGKDLCHRIQEILDDTRFTLDVKTLRRSVETLEREEKLKVVIATVPHGTRTLLLSPELSASDQIVQNYIAKLNEFIRSGPISANTQKLNQLKEAMHDPDFFVEGSLPLGVPQNPSVNLRALSQFGYIHGILSRAKLFHHYLLSKQVDFSFETIPIVFDQISLNLYFKLVGIVRMSKGLYESFSELNSTSLISLPETFREELALNRKRFQSQAAILLSILEQLKLIEGEEQFSSLNFRLPLKYNLAKDVPLYDHNGNIQRFIKFSESSTAFEDYWNGMQEICTNFHSRHTTSIYDDDTVLEDHLIPKAVLLARHPDSWKLKPSRERDLERAVKKLAYESYTMSKSKRPRIEENNSESESEELHSLSEEFQVSIDRLKQMFENYLRLLEEREEAKRLDKLATRKQQQQQQQQQRSADSDESEDSDDEGLDHLRWTPTDWSKLSLAFCILQQPPFLSLNPNSASAGIKWNLATRIFDKPKSPVVVRRHGLKLFKSYSELKRMLELDTIVSLVMRTCAEFEDLSDLSNLFKSVFDSCQFIIDSESDEIFDSFKIPDSGSNSDELIILPSRQEHFLDTIDTWVQTRSFRHGLFLHDPGLQKFDVKLEISKEESNIIRLLRQILITSTTELFNYDANVELIKAIDPETLSSAINNLIASGFAARNRSKDKYRLFRSPLSISESVREVIEFSQEQFDRETITVDCNTETLSIKRIEDILNNFTEINTNLFTLNSLNSIKFDCPVEIKLNQNVSKINYDLSALQSSDSSAIWFTPTAPHVFIPSVAIGCLGHLESKIKSKPGISVHILKKQYISILGEAQIFDVLIETLVKCGRVELIESKYLQ